MKSHSSVSLHSLIPVCAAVLAGAAILATSAGCRPGHASADSADSADTAVYDPAMTFDADSAYGHLAAQVGLGPRVPGTRGHDRCRQYLLDALGRYAPDTVVVQDFTRVAFTGDTLPLTNILARYNMDAPVRVLIGAHWDTRPWADQDLDRDNRAIPFDGANDGASGTAALLELARLMHQRLPQVGVDLAFLDGEDYGKDGSWGHENATWCLGSQYLAAHYPAPRPYAGVVLDMIGGRGARFHRTVEPDDRALPVTEAIWEVARRTGHADRFVDQHGGSIIDDHTFLTAGGIPSTVIVESLNPQTQSFNPTWHTQADGLSNIDRQAVASAGQVVTNFIYEHPATATATATAR